MLKKIRKLAGLSINEIYLLVIAFFLVSIFKLLIKILPFNFLQKSYQNWVKSDSSATADELETARKALAINRVASVFYFFGFTCLPKAMALKYWLKSFKNISLHFGIQKNNQNDLVAHAWVTNANKTILGDDPSINYKSIWVWE